MREQSIKDARNTLTNLIRSVERGGAVRLTRRGKPVAVLVSDREYSRLAAAHARKQPDFLKFVQEWRREMIAKGVPFATDEEIANLRSRAPARPFSFDEQ